MNEILEKYLYLQNSIKDLSNDLWNKYNIDLSEVKEVEDMRNIKWLRTTDMFGNFKILRYSNENYSKNLILSSSHNLIQIYEEDDLLIVYFDGEYSSEGSDIYSLPRCILLSKNNETIKS